jgi:hypothetical protein
MIDLTTYKSLGDKKDSNFFDEYLPRIDERRVASGLDEMFSKMPGHAERYEHGHVFD